MRSEFVSAKPQLPHMWMKSAPTARERSPNTKIIERFIECKVLTV
jgi:hypothetical protein